MTSLMIVILNMIPIQAAGGFVWDGKKILRWNKTMRAMLAMPTLALVILDLLI
ncbi:MAG: hypothetical protein QW566_06990 [Candidatus Jordarchaeales archaeon]